MKDFPILHGGRSIPFGFVEQFRKPIEKNHGQTVERLAQRGGLTAWELWGAALGISLQSSRKEEQTPDAVSWLNEALTKY